MTEYSIEDFVTNAKSAVREKKRKHSDCELTKSNSTITSLNQYPYEVTNDDHCETPAAAYSDIMNILNQLAKSLGKSADSLLIYDPYFCEGSVIDRLSSIGFTNVYNAKEDFYKVYDEGRMPEYDILLTNPPYSGSNMEKLVRICCASQKPWFLLMPNYVYTKDYYTSFLLSCSPSPFYVVPSKQRYCYTTPKVS
jgi:hypothetical protein